LPSRPTSYIVLCQRTFILLRPPHSISQLLSNTFLIFRLLQCPGSQLYKHSPSAFSSCFLPFSRSHRKKSPSLRLLRFAILFNFHGFYFFSPGIAFLLSQTPVRGHRPGLLLFFHLVVPSPGLYSSPPLFFFTSPPFCNPHTGGRYPSFLLGLFPHGPSHSMTLLYLSVNRLSSSIHPFFFSFSRSLFRVADIEGYPRFLVITFFSQDLFSSDLQSFSAISPLLR